MSVVERAIQKLRNEKIAAGEAPVTSAPATAASTAHTTVPVPAAGAPKLRPSAIVFDRVALRAAGLLPPEEEVDLLARQYRSIKHPLIAPAIGRGMPRAPKGYLIMIASAMPGEGKSFTALNLALSLAVEKDLRVLLVDADVAKPQLSRELGLGKAPGLLDALRDTEIDVESLIHPSDVPTLALLPAGSGAEEATELLSSARMLQIATLLGQSDRQRIVVFDSPPLLQTTESLALARICGQIVVVVRAESTPQPVLVDALKKLGNHPAVSLVLNQSEHAGTSNYYYGYGERADAGAPEAQQ